MTKKKAPQEPGVFYTVYDSTASYANVLDAAGEIASWYMGLEELIEDVEYDGGPDVSDAVYKITVEGPFKINRGKTTIEGLE